MPWNSFNDNREALAQQYAQDQWDVNDGMCLDELGKAAIKLLDEQKQLPKPCIKANLLKLILENAQLELVPQDYFADKINHGNIIGNVRSAWFNHIRENELAEIIRENEAPGSLRNLHIDLENAPELNSQTITVFRRAKDADRAADELRQAMAGRAFNGNTDFSHAAPAWQDILQLGLPGLLERAKNARIQKENAGSLTPQQDVFYRCCETVYEALIVLMRRYGSLADRMYASTGRENMLAVKDCCLALARRAPETMHEALQLIVSFYTLHTFVEGVGIRSLGCLDYMLYPFYRADLDCGRLTQQQARDIISCFYYKFYAMKVLANSPITLGSMDENGKSTYNELTDLLLDVYGSLNIHDPKFQIRYTPDLPDAFLKKALRLIIAGNSSIVFMNDDVVIRGLCGLGQELQDARKYIPVGCYESMALGTEVPCSCNGRINIPKAVELMFTGGVDMLSGDLLCADHGQPADFEAFYAAVLDILQGFINRSMALINAYERFYPELNPSPVFSATFASCMESGVDAYSGGAKYNNSSINAFGVAETVDALLAVKHLVYQDKKLSYGQLADLLKNNWAGEETLRQWVKIKLPKYGNNDAEADALARRLVDDVSAMINLKPNGRGGIYRCGGFSIDACEFFGKVTGALPNGRLAQEMLSKNMCAVVGADKKGVTGLIQSVTEIDFTRMPNGTVLDVTFHESAVRGEEGLQAMLGTLKVYMQRGGYAIHYNVLDPSVLREAQANPEKYRSLQIRLCGWNVYFVNLTREEQDAFIRRAEHSAV